MGRELVAVNTAPDSENEMHGAAAQRYGFSSGLVPGVDVLACLAGTEPDLLDTRVFYSGYGRIDELAEVPIERLDDP